MDVRLEALRALLEQPGGERPGLPASHDNSSSPWGKMRAWATSVTGSSFAGPDAPAFAGSGSTLRRAKLLRAGATGWARTSDDWRRLSAGRRGGRRRAIGAWVFDSDYGQVLAIDDDRRAAVAIRPELAEDHLDHDAAELAAGAPRAERPDRCGLQAIVDRDDVFVEETIDETPGLFRAPGPYDALETLTVQASLPIRIGKAVKTTKRRRPTLASIAASDLGGYLQPLGYMVEETYIGRKAIPWRELRYVPGLGEGFIGIWDREAPEAPITRFAISRRGDARLTEALERLQTPRKVELLGANGLGGFVAPLAIMGADVRVAERDLRLESSRFVPGEGHRLRRDLRPPRPRSRSSGFGRATAASSPPTSASQSSSSRSCSRRRSLREKGAGQYRRRGGRVS